MGLCGPQLRTKITAHCNRYRKGKPYSRRAVELALEYFRALWIVSPVVERTRLNQAVEMQTFTGRIVTPHHVFAGRCRERKILQVYSAQV